MTPEQRLELLRADHDKLRQELFKLTDLLEYYRSLTCTSWERSMPPTGYWIRRGESNAVWGALIDGDLIPKGKTDVYEEALEACWAHYDKLHEGVPDA